MSDSWEDFDEEFETHDTPPGPEITPELIREWILPRFGSANPEKMNNPVWEWLIRTRMSAFSAYAYFDRKLASNEAEGWFPGWCFNRFGQSVTKLTDGRIVLIGGEHEDYYDPDFCIYNDVVVRHPDGHIDIFGYPKEIFPPTDSHTATRVGDRIIIIGSIGYAPDRQYGITPVMILDLKTFAISKAITQGDAPGWMHNHRATLSEDGASILLQGGKIDRSAANKSMVENIDDWRLHLAECRWERLTDRQWQRWEFTRKDEARNYLFDARNALWYRDMDDYIGATLAQHGDAEIAKLTQAYGIPPDLNLVMNLYRPGVAYEPLPEAEDDHRVTRIKVHGIVIRYVEGRYSIQMTVEGDLPQSVIDLLTSDLLSKLSRLENTPYELKRL